MVILSGRVTMWNKRMEQKVESLFIKQLKKLKKGTAGSHFVVSQYCDITSLGSTAALTFLYFRD